jgi:hypothetical protein
VPALVGVVRLVKLTNSCFEDLKGVEARILPEERSCRRGA